jgi:hypothetical protein|tara:strand:+ start:130 stop:498 length:369 start_codon:yes stop_codon:yes gene_type:complete
VHLERISNASQVSNLGPRSLITRMCQGFMQNVAFPLQFEFLFSFPGSLQPHARWSTAHPRPRGLEPSRTVSLDAARLLPWAHTKPRFRALSTDRKVFSASESAEDALVNPNFSLREWFNRYW